MTRRTDHTTRRERHSVSFGDVIDWTTRHPTQAAAVGAGLGVTLATLLRRPARRRFGGRSGADASAPAAFGSGEHDRMLRRTLSHAHAGAAELGECLHAAGCVGDGDGEGWMAAWTALAERVDEQGHEALAGGATIDARGAFLRACNYYRTAQAGTSPAHPRYHRLWMASVAAFRKAAPLFDPPIGAVGVPFEDAVLPGYFWRPDESRRARPTLVVAGGSDDTIEEDVLIFGRAAIERGYNLFTFSYPGHRNALHTDRGQVKRPDYELPFGAAFDVLETLEGVDERIALLGFGGGGYVAPRVAIHDERVQAVVANNPIVDYGRVAGQLLGPLDDADAEWADFVLGDDLHRIACPALALVGAAAGDEMLAQTRAFYGGVSSPQKRMHVFTLDQDGSHDGWMLDNLARLHQVTFAWLRETMPVTARRVFA